MTGRWAVYCSTPDGYEAVHCFANETNARKAADTLTKTTAQEIRVAPIRAWYESEDNLNIELSPRVKYDRQRRIDKTRGITYKRNATGSRRRLQALMTIGWSLRQIEIQMNYSHGTLTNVMTNQYITRRKEQDVKNIYNTLWNKKPIPVTHAEKVAVSKTINHARKKNYAPPMAWDDDTIDDPTATPAIRGGDHKSINYLEERLEQVKHLYNLGLPDHVIADRLGISERTIIRDRTKLGLFKIKDTRSA